MSLDSLYYLPKGDFAEQKKDFVRYMEDEYPSVYNKSHARDLLVNLVDFVYREHGITAYSAISSLADIIPEVNEEDLEMFLPIFDDGTICPCATVESRCEMAMENVCNRVEEFLRDPNNPGCYLIDISESVSAWDIYQLCKYGDFTLEAACEITALNEKERVDSSGRGSWDFPGLPDWLNHENFGLTDAELFFLMELNINETMAYMDSHIEYFVDIDKVRPNIEFYEALHAPSSKKKPTSSDAGGDEDGDHGSGLVGVPANDLSPVKESPDKDGEFGERRRMDWEDFFKQLHQPIEEHPDEDCPRPNRGRER